MRSNSVCLYEKYEAVTFMELPYWVAPEIKNILIIIKLGNCFFNMLVEEEHDGVEFIVVSIFKMLLSKGLTEQCTTLNVL